MNEVVLLGDSIFDNAAYVRGGPDVRRQVQAGLPEGWRVTLLAQDGSVTSDLPDQFRRLPASASHLIISTGGNDAVNQLGLLSESSSNVSEVLETLWSVQAQFRETYRNMLAEALSYGFPTAACTVYFPAFEDQALQRAASAGLTFFNEAILLEAARSRIPVLDLRLIFTEPEDYANPIEPSATGGAKLADVICRVVLEHDFAIPGAKLYF